MGSIANGRDKIKNELESRITTKFFFKVNRASQIWETIFFKKDLAFPLSKSHEKRRRKIRLKITQEIMTKNLENLPRDKTPQI